MKESELEKKFTDYCKLHGLMVRKFTSPSNRGVVDRIVINANGVVAFIELKAPGQKPTALQRLEAARLVSRGCLHWTIDSLERTYEVLNWLRFAPAGYVPPERRKFAGLCCANQARPL